MDNFRSEYLPDFDAPPEEEKQGGVRRFFMDLLETLVLSLFLFLAINAISARIRVESISMQPTLYAGDFIIVNKLAYKLGEPNRGDIIIFHYPPDPNREPYIKRVIGLPGETVRVSSGNVYVNDVSLDEPYISAAPNYEGSWVVPEDSLFMLGDNRNSSSDSHSWGMVPLKNVIGKAEIVYWPPTDWQLLNEATAAAAEP
ncbi:MAG: signal peptidase I [Anaerolineales bacterium]